MEPLYKKRPPPLRNNKYLCMYFEIYQKWKYYYTQAIILKWWKNNDRKIGNSGKILGNDFNCDVTDAVTRTSLKPRKYHNKNGEFLTC